MFVRHLGLGGGSSRSVVLLGSGRSNLFVGRSIDILIFLSGAVNGNLDGDDATINILAVHLADGLGLKFLRGKVNESEAASLATLVASLQLLDHETGDRAKGNLGRDGLVGGENLLELRK
jgi:hypothetical protein